MMLGLWIILMFGSGMPGLYIYGIVWLMVVDVTDRWYLSKMCKQPVRYGQSLPVLLLGEQQAANVASSGLAILCSLHVLSRCSLFRIQRCFSLAAAPPSPFKLSYVGH